MNAQVDDGDSVREAHRVDHLRIGVISEIKWFVGRLASARWWRCTTRS